MLISVQFLPTTAPLASDGVMILTIRQRPYIDLEGGKLSKLPVKVQLDMMRRFDKGRFVFHPDNLPPIDGEITYGEAIIPSTYIEQRWTDTFDLMEVGTFNSDPYQVPVVLKKRQTIGCK